MSNNYDKIVKLACKPKNAPPKAKYVDVLVSATFSDDGSLNDIVRALSLRLREPNAVVVFKALIVLHQMIRTGSTDQLLQYLSQGDALRLRNVNGQNWEGYSPPASMGSYAQYLDARVGAFKDLRHDLVQVQAESNRRSDGLGAGSKARRLRHLPVEKGLLREVKQVQKVLDVLVKCRFYDDDLRDENTVLAFRMIIKDLLVLFQAGNEGVCNILEHYFEMSKPDATEAFDIYKSFIKQTDKVVDYLGVVRKLHNIVNVPVPNLKHAPTSLVKALEEYLHDPNFEENRREYKASLGVVEGKPAQRTPSPNPAAKSADVKPAPSASTSAAPAPSSSAPAAAPPGASRKIQDFFDSIQSSQQPTMFGGPAQQFPPQMQMQQPAFNPFRQSMMMPQQTGFMQPQMTGFGMPQQTQPFLHPQATGQMAFGSLSNRQSMFPQNTGAFGQMNNGPFGQQSNSFGQPTETLQSNTLPGMQQPTPLMPQSTGSNPFRQSMMVNTSVGPSGAMSQPASPFGFNQNQIQRPGSTPAFTAEPKPLTAQPTGSNNPFAPPGGILAKVETKPKGMSMNELAWNKHQAQFQPPPMQPNNTASPSPWGTSNGKPAEATGLSDIASSFTFDSNKTGSSSNDFMSQFGSLSMANTGSTSQFGSLSSNPTGPSSPLKTGGSGGFLQPQPTGFGGSTVKRFQPTSSFGSQLMETLPPIQEPGSNSTATSPAGVQPQSTGYPFSQSQPPSQSSQPNPVSAQMTGAPNPFRQSTFGSLPSPSSTQAGPGGLPNFSTGPFGANSPFAGQNGRPSQAQPQQPQGTGFGGAGGGFGGAFGQFGQFGQGAQQPQQSGSLI